MRMPEQPKSTSARAVQADVSLSHCLLGHGSSPAIRLPCGAQTVDDGILGLGPAELGRWSVTLLSAAESRQLSHSS